MKNLRLLLSLLCIFTIQLSFANHDEAVDGELSDDPQNPTFIELVDGSNVICAGSLAPDMDFFTITVPPGATLDEIVLTSLNSLNVGFLGLYSGVVADPDSGIDGLLGWTHLGQVNGPQLAELNANGGIGFMIPLGPGDYTFWTQETSSAAPTEYCLDFQLTIPPPPIEAIPTMGEWGLISLGLLMLIFGVNQITSFSRNRNLPTRA